MMTLGKDGNYDVIVEEVSSTIEYIGKHARKSGGAPTDSDRWQIKRIYDDGTTTNITWADGSDDFEKVWDDRASYAYQ